MPSDLILSKIIESTFTVHDIHRRIRILKKYLIGKFFSPAQTEDEEVREELAWLSTLDDQFYAHFSKENVYELFEDLEKKIGLLSVLTVYLAFEPSKEEIMRIGVWLRQNTQNHSIFDLKYDWDLIGGCALVQNGIYKDYSIRANLQENSGQVTEIIRGSLGRKG